jgi:hypothetical protein
VDDVESVEFTNKKKKIRIWKEHHDKQQTIELFEFEFDYAVHHQLIQNAVESSIDQWDYDTMIHCETWDETKQMQLTVIHTDDIWDDQPTNKGNIALSIPSWDCIPIFMDCAGNAYRQKCKDWYLRWKGIGSETTKRQKRLE